MTLYHQANSSSLSHHKLFACILSLLVSSTALADNPPIEKRSLSNSQNATTTANTSTEWQLYQKILELDEEITQLRDKVERMEGAVDKAQKSQTNFQASIEQRLNNQEDAIIEVVDKLEGTDTETDSQASATDEKATNKKSAVEKSQDKENANQTLKKTPTNTVKPKQVNKQTLKNNTSTNSDSVTISSEEKAKKAYLSAYSVFKRQGKSAGVANMTKFINSYPNSKLIPSAHFWIGEFYLSGSKPDFLSAKNSFITVIQKYPNSQKVPKSLYRLGYIAKISKRDDIAKRFMREILSKHPNSREAGLAKAFLDRYNN